jgi:aerobic carbon-monoxide dehydrogenase medium subunit
MYAFQYHHPSSLVDAAKLLTGDAKLLAGGHTLIPTMKQRLANPSALIDLSGVAELRGIQKSATGILIGAMTTHDEVANSPVVRSAMAGLCDVAAGIGDPHVRNRGTIGGSIANNDPAADYPAAALALGATIATNRREIKADDFFTGLFSTALGEGEIITRIAFPIPAKFAYVKFANPVSRSALVGVAVAQTNGGPRVAVTGAGNNGVFRHTGMEGALAKDWTAQSLAGLATNASDMMSDMHADAAYRAHLVGVLAKRAVAKAG